MNTKIGDARILENDVRFARMQLDDIEEDLKELEKANAYLNFGHVVVSSGLEGTETKPYSDEPFDDLPWKSEMDWALVKVDPLRIKKCPYNTVRAAALIVSSLQG